MALPWLESVPVWGDDTAEGRVVRAAGAARLPVLRQRLPQQGVVGQGRRRQAWSWARCSSRCSPFREKLLFLRGLYNQEALIGGIHSCQTGNLLTGAHLASGGEIRSGVSMDQVVAERPQGPDQGAEPGAGLRAVDRGPAQELLDDLQLAHLVELGRPRRRRWSCTPPWPSTACSATRSAGPTRACSTPSWTTPRGFRSKVSQSDQHRLDEYLSSVREVEQRIDQAGKDRPAAGLAADPAPSRTCPAPPTASRRTSTSTCG